MHYVQPSPDIHYLTRVVTVMMSTFCHEQLLRPSRFDSMSSYAASALATGIGTLVTWPPARIIR